MGKERILNKKKLLLCFCAFVISFSAAPGEAKDIFVPIKSADNFLIITGYGGAIKYIPSNGDGTLGPASVYEALPLGRMDHIRGVEVSDIDSDGDNDFITIEGYPEEFRIILYANDGSGSFLRSQVGTAAYRPEESLKVADFNGDGRQDLVVAGIGWADIYLQSNSGSFPGVSQSIDFTPHVTPSPDYATSSLKVDVGDIDSDGHQDLFFLELRSKRTAYLSKGDGSGIFPPVQKVYLPYTFEGSSFSLFDADVDGDLDLVTGGSRDNPKFFVYLNDGSGNFLVTNNLGEHDFEILGPSFHLKHIDTCDFDRDGDHDLIISQYKTGDIYYVENSNGVLLEPALIGNTVGNTQGIAASPVRAGKGKYLVAGD